MVDLLRGNPPKLDNVAVNGLLGVADSLAYRTMEIEAHIHSREEWLSLSGDQSGTDWCESVSDAGMPDNFVAISGDDTYGADADDEAKIIGTGDASAIAGMVMFDLHKILILAADDNTIFILRVVYGTGTMADAITADQYSEIVVRRDAAIQENHGVPVSLQMPRLIWGTDKVWIQAKNTTDNAEIGFLVGLHNYVG